MTIYDLHTKNSYGNYWIAIFNELPVLLKFILDNPLDDKTNYLIFKKSDTRERIEIPDLIKRVESNPKHYTLSVINACETLKTK